MIFEAFYQYFATFEYVLQGLIPEDFKQHLTVNRSKKLYLNVNLRPYYSSKLPIIVLDHDSQK